MLYVDRNMARDYHGRWSGLVSAWQIPSGYRGAALPYLPVLFCISRIWSRLPELQACSTVLQGISIIILNASAVVFTWLAFCFRQGATFAMPETKIG